MPPRSRTDHIGSLIRPAALLSARASVDPHIFDSQVVQAGITDQAVSSLAEIQASAIRDVVAEQIARGVLPLTSGEFERFLFVSGFFNKLPGIEMRWGDFNVDFRPGVPQAKYEQRMGSKGREVEIATKKVNWTRSAYLDDWLFLRDCLPKERWSDAKWTLPPPIWIHLLRKDGTAYDKGVYESDEELLSDLSAATRGEMLALYDAGLRWVQIDDPTMSFFCDPEFRADLEKEGTDPEKLLDMYIKAHNDVLAGLPEDLFVQCHLCRGNGPEAVYLTSGGYEPIAEKMLRRLNYKAFALEFDSDRAGDFQPLRFLPRDKAVVLGLVTTKYAELEDLDTLKARAYQAADIIAKGQGRTREEVLRENLAVSPQCGFASVNFGKGKGFDEQIQWQKLELVKKLAQEIWP